VSAWAGPVGGFNVSASRDVVNGTYYGSDSKIQLVDSIGVRASIGFFMGIDGVAQRAKGLTPSGSANVSVIRNYVHVRPIADMHDALKTDWTDMFVAGFMGKLAAILKTGPTAPAPELVKQLREFLKGLAPNESFIVTDTLAVGATAQASIPIPILLNPALRSFNPSVGMRLSAQPQVLRRTTFVRTETGLQVYLQDARMGSLDIELNFNWLVNILMAGYNSKVADADAQAFLLDTDKMLQTADADQLRALTVGLRALLRFQQVAPLREKFPYYELDHHLTSNTARVKILPFQFRHLKEEHTVTISPPGYPEGHDRTLFSQKVVDTRGLDLWSMLSDLVRSFTNGLVNLASRSGSNPANSFLGNGYWTTVQTEAEVTPSRPSRPVTMIEHSWGGWILKRKHLLKILDRIQEKVLSLNLDRPLIRREVFATTEQLQLYEISSTLLVYDPGVQKILKDLIEPMSPEQAVESMVAVEGRADLEEFCQTARPRNRHISREDGRRFKFSCLKPWMEDALEVRQTVLRKGYPDTPTGKVRFTNFILKKLEDKVELAPLLKWIGKDNFLFQIRVSGFRTKDENGDTEYLSDTIGTRDTDDNAGAFRDFINETGLSGTEVYGSYLSEGY